MKLNAFLAVSAIALLAACGGSSTGGSSFEQLAQRGTDLIVKHYYSNETPVNRLPVGAVTYRGVASFNNSPIINENFLATADPLATIRLDLNVAANTVSGEVTNITSFDGSPASGTVTISNGNFAGNTFIADTRGTVFYQGQAATVNGRMDGIFIGANGEAVFGTSAGTFGGRPFYGAYIAER